MNSIAADGWIMMTVTASKSGPKGQSCAGRTVRVLSILLLVVVGALLLERWRGHKALHAWMQASAGRGESLDLTILWPKPDEQNRQFSDRLSHATKQLPAELTAFCGIMPGIVPDECGRARRGSQEARPPSWHAATKTNTWPQVEAAVRKGAPAVEDLRRLMKRVPASLGDDILERMKTEALPNFVRVRVGAQTFHALVIHDLHRGNLDGALENLEALSAFVQIHADEPTLVNFMIRVAIAGLAVDAYWDALQAPGWTENQLVRLQQAAQSRLSLAQLPRVVQAERAARLYSWESFRAESYETWLDRYKEIYQSFGAKPPARSADPPFRQWQQWVFHPLWGFAWADQEELHYLGHTQLELQAIRDAVMQGSWLHLNERLNVIEQDYRPPPARWRFHGRLPVLDELATVIGASRLPEPTCPYPDFRRAWLASSRNLTLHELVITAIALKRHELRHGKPPATLNALVPDFLPAVPRDFMDGQALRYRPNRDGSFVLYSVGEDTRDDGGDPDPNTADGDDRSNPWNGRDWVWPQVVSGATQPGA